MLIDEKCRYLRSLQFVFTADPPESKKRRFYQSGVRSYELRLREGGDSSTRMRSYELRLRQPTKNFGRLAQIGLHESNVTHCASMPAGHRRQAAAHRIE